MDLSLSSPLTEQHWKDKHPQSWTKEEVKQWLSWCKTEFSLDNVAVDRFGMNGKALCLLQKEAFLHRAPYAGDVLHEHLQRLLLSSGSGGELSTPGLPYYRHLYFPLGAGRHSPPTQTKPGISSRQAASPPTSSIRSAIPSREVASPLTSSIRMNISADYSYPDFAERLKLLESADAALNLSIPERPNSDSGNSSPGITEDDLHGLTAKNGTFSNSDRHIRHRDSLLPERAVEPSSNLYSKAEQVSSVIPKKRPFHYSQREENGSFPNSGDGLSSSQRRSSSEVPQPSSKGMISSLQHRSDSAITSSHGPYVSYSTESEVFDEVSSHRMIYPTNLSLLGSNDSHANHWRPMALGSWGHMEAHSPRGGAHQVNASSLPLARSRGRTDSSSSENSYFLKHSGLDLLRGSPPKIEQPQPGSPPCARIGKDCRLLWDFIIQLLSDETYKPYISWEDREKRVFRIHDQQRIAQLWGQQKNRTNMTYEKMSRALRYYYKMGIIQKEQGQKLTYRFLQDRAEIANAPRFSKFAKGKQGPTEKRKLDSPDINQGRLEVKYRSPEHFSLAQPSSTENSPSNSTLVQCNSAPSLGQLTAALQPATVGFPSTQSSSTPPVIAHPHRGSCSSDWPRFSFAPSSEVEIKREPSD